MKKIIAFLLCMVIALSMSVTAFAETSNSWGGSSAVTYEIESSYSIYIPEEINLNTGYTFTAEMLNITDNLQVNVSATNLNPQGKLEVQNEKGETIALTLQNAINGRIGKFTDSTTSDITFIASADEGGKAGKYTGTIEFVFDISSRE